VPPKALTTMSPFGLPAQAARLSPFFIPPYLL
jgi:hypothetical protein